MSKSLLRTLRAAKRGEWTAGGNKGVKIEMKILQMTHAEQHEDETPD